jgi:hypothetical protein
MYEWHPWDPPPTALYVVLMIGAWTASMAGVVMLALRLYRTRAPGGATPLPSPS